MNAIAKIELFERNGTPFAGKAQINEQGRPCTMRERACSRCGGAGHSDRWIRTGRVCFDCGGSGKSVHGPKAVKLYTAEQLAKLNASADKRAAKRLAAAEAKAAADLAVAEARREQFLAEHGALLDRAGKYAERSEFIADVTRRAYERSALSEKQAEALANAVARIEHTDAMRAASRHVGSIGERIEIAVTVDRVAQFERPRYGYNNLYETVFIVTMRDANGNAIVSKSPNFAPEKGEQFTIRATVKDHSEYRGEAQTIVQRAKAIKKKETA